MRSLAALSLLVAAGCSSNFCSSNVSIPSSKFGNCNQSELNPAVVNGTENVWAGNWLGAQCPSGFANNACTQALGLQ